jgi:Zn-dependent peptidase ImmA (M78 family)
MYSPVFRIKSNGVPILSKMEIDCIAERCLMDFCPKALEAPQPIDEDRFLTEYLGLDQDFQYLTHCGLYLGMVIFEDSNKIAVYNKDTNRAEYIKAKKGTVIIDNTLLEENQEHRYRFTAIHEAGHWLFHRHKYCKKTTKFTLYDISNVDSFKCRANNIEGKFKPVEQWNDNDTMEWQANYFSSALLMPKSMMSKLCNDKNIVHELKCQSYWGNEMYNSLLIDKVSEVFNVSKKAAEIRLKNLYLCNNSFENYKSTSITI